MDIKTDIKTIIRLALQVQILIDLAMTADAPKAMRIREELDLSMRDLIESLAEKKQNT
jgi:hypothetical protein